ncbi:hypothetical protein QV08_06130 [Gallibacterium salpingitidis]|uniref:Uncharacterized protein n=1 Tax=Gallibacterium salpingitidis TaxID=505341 RepID=A0A1A7P3I7_9PAST|nr:hypothetical protein QS62_00665 [Gallibacterium salpingitidis]OBX07935.1 hypothetical protein QV08_06130 [Gallibacterium salpingitidis]OBX11472.1 hypothetical protein QV09_02565 [Gallibacterium salpingitidis]
MAFLISNLKMENFAAGILCYFGDFFNEKRTLFTRKSHKYSLFHNNQKIFSNRKIMILKNLFTQKTKHTKNK